MNFKIGDRVMIISSRRPERVGWIATVESELTYINLDTGRPWGRGLVAHMLDIPHGSIPCSRAGYAPHRLRLIDDYDGYEKTSWSNCVWQPKETVKVTMNNQSLQWERS